VKFIWNFSVENNKLSAKGVQMKNV